ncbi:hypothetical protein [Cyanobium sp. Morenito 9A2]|uniref:hypothetical protein n=1 Tax=Cyanobium sp. Morenito 9A2 TaxID=2823718 RepID=UPI0020CFB6EC|nr:hypothetical protein [Cyanobium sp. Morenito 9A2]
MERLDLLTPHGLNRPEQLAQSLIFEAIATEAIEAINVAWDFIRWTQARTGPSIEAARVLDVGVFMISPRDKRGHLQTPSDRLQGCAPPCTRHFNDLFGLRADAIARISVGGARLETLDHRLEAVVLSPRAGELMLPDPGLDWPASWEQRFPPGKPPPALSTCRCCSAGTTFRRPGIWRVFSAPAKPAQAVAVGWSPGANPGALDGDVSVAHLWTVPSGSPWGGIQVLLRALRPRVGGRRRRGWWPAAARMKRRADVSRR